MGTPHSPSPVKLVVGLLAASDALLSAATHTLCARFGPLDAASAPIDWDASSYYSDEMGAALRRQFLSFEHLVPAGKLAGLKQLTNQMEATWQAPAGRQVNIDPGYIAATKLVLASTKDAAHRVYLSGGMYAEVALHFNNGSFRPHAHSYPDYAAAAAIAFFNRVRSDYLAQLRGVHQPSVVRRGWPRAGA